MPIKPENKNRYPKNWQAIRADILERASNRCEWCHKPNGIIVRVRKAGVKTLWYCDFSRTWADIKGFANFEGFGASGYIFTDPVREVRVVLTVAHLDHTPENSDPANLRALCQACHNRYDAPHRAETRRNSKHHA